MNPKIRPEHLARAAVIYVRQSTLGQVEHHTESKRRQYSLADTATSWGLLRWRRLMMTSGARVRGWSNDRDFRSLSPWCAVEALEQ